jgi:hypothetical protein
VVAVVVAVSVFAGVLSPAGPTGALSSLTAFESAVGASDFLVDCEKMKQISSCLTQVNGETNLRDRLLCSTNDAEEHTEHTEQGEDSNGDGTSGLGLSLDGEDRVDLGQFDKLEDSLADERDRCPSEGRRRSISILLERLFLLDVRSLLDLGLDIEGLLSEGLRILDGVADVDVVEEDVLGHRPELNTDTANLVKGLNGRLVLEEPGVGDLARGPDALVRRVVDERGVPFALVVRVGLGRAKIEARSEYSPERAG